MASKKDARYGKGEHEIQGDLAELWLNPAHIVVKLRAALRSEDYEPPLLPAVAMELVAVASQAEVPFSKIRSLVESEPMIAANVLRLAQTAHYSRGSPVASLEDAMSRLGLQTLVDLFLQESIKARVFRVKGYEAPLKSLSHHATVTAHVVRQLCRITGFPDEYAFMCGLLHDVGIAGAIHILADVGRGNRPPEYRLCADSVLAVHEEASAVLAKAWQLPADVQLVLGHHHHYEIDGYVHPLAASICVADWIATESGAGAGNEVRDEAAKKAIGEIQLTEGSIRQLLQFAGSLT